MQKRPCVLLIKQYSGGQIEKNEVGGACVWRKSEYRLLMEKPERCTPLGRPRRIWEDNIKMNLQAVGWRAWVGSIWLKTGTNRWRAVVNAVMNLRVL